MDPAANVELLAAKLSRLKGALGLDRSSILIASRSYVDAKAIATLAYLHNGKLDYPARVLRYMQDPALHGLIYSSVRPALALDLNQRTKFGLGIAEASKCSKPHLELLPGKAAWIAPFTAEVDMSVGGNRRSWKLKTLQPVIENESQGVVLTRRIATVTTAAVLAITRCLETEMQRKIIHGALKLRIGHSPFTVKG